MKNFFEIKIIEKTANAIIIEPNSDAELLAYFMSIEHDICDDCIRVSRTIDETTDVSKILPEISRGWSHVELRLSSDGRDIISTEIMPAVRV